MQDSSTALSSNDENNRRSKRERTSTITWIDGHAVLRQNNYVVRGGEYVMGEDGMAAPPKKQKDPPPKTAASAPKKLKVTPPHEILRIQHNEQVQRMSQPKQQLRWKFLANQLHLLRYFCEPSILKQLSLTVNQNSLSYTPLKVNKAPKVIQATLRDYQMQGLEFMVNMHQQNLSMILGDEMGLGKTLQTISFLSWLKEHEGIRGPSLVICPLSVLSSWCSEMTKWAPSMKFFRLHASNTDEQLAQKHELSTNATAYDVILTTYEMAKVPLLKSLYARLHFHYLVLDEGHKIKGHLTQIAQAVRGIHCGNKLLLTGTPLQNNMVELWSLLNFLYPSIFTTSEPFGAGFNLAENIIDKQFLNRAQQLLDLFMLRRLKHKVETFIPPKLETKVYCPLSKTQTFWYKSLLMKDMGNLANCEKDQALGGARHSMLKSLFMQLRKCCNHPFVFDGAEVNPESTSLQDLIAASGKLSVLDMLLQRLFQNQHRAVLFSQFTSVLDILEDYCRLRGWKYCRLDGSTDRARRNYYIRRFNEDDSSYFLFLVSTRSGGMGLNLQSADTCILYDSDWNPQSDIQAMGRVHRIGQTKTVHVYRLVSAGTVEERMLERAEKKLLLEMVNQETKDTGEDEKVRSLSAAELLEDIKFGSQAVFGDGSKNELPTWEEIDTITDRARTESDTIGKLQGNAMQSANEFDATREFSETQRFGDIDFRKIRQEQERLLKAQIPQNLRGIGHLWQEISQLNQKRDRKNRIVMVQGLGSGYGSAAVPVLKSNDYELENGESSVFDRELHKDNKKKCAVPKKKKGSSHENQDFCQVCGDGGHLVLCPRCPCSVHLSCVGLRWAKDFKNCTHHNCGVCQKNRASAGGLLYPCHACATSYCEDCLPKSGVTFMDRVEQLEKLKFDSAKAQVYILCSDHCHNVAKQEFGFSPPRVAAVQKCPEPIDVSFGFGNSVTVEEQIQEANQAKAAAAAGSTGRTRSKATVADVSFVQATKTQPNICNDYLRWKALPLAERAIEKVSPSSKEVIAVYSSFKDAAKRIGLSYAGLYSNLRANNPSNWAGYDWYLTDVKKARDPVRSGSKNNPILIHPSHTTAQNTSSHPSHNQAIGTVATVTPPSID